MAASVIFRHPIRLYAQVEALLSLQLQGMCHGKELENSVSPVLIAGKELYSPYFMKPLSLWKKAVV